MWYGIHDVINDYDFTKQKVVCKQTNFCALFCQTANNIFINIELHCMLYR